MSDREAVPIRTPVEYEAALARTEALLAVARSPRRDRELERLVRALQAHQDSSTAPDARSAVAFARFRAEREGPIGAGVAPTGRARGSRVAPRRHIATIEPPPGIEAVNALHRLLLTAGVLLRLSLSEAPRGPEEPGPWTLPLGEPLDAATLAPRKRLQLAALSAACRRLENEGRVVVYCDDMSWTHRGIDVVAVDLDTRRPILVEVKATTRAIPREPRILLAETRQKGRQLSLGWCIESMIELGAFAPSADTFFRIVRPVIEERFARMLVVCRFANADAADPLDVRIETSATLCRLDGEAQRRRLVSLREQLVEVDASDLPLRTLSLGFDDLERIEPRRG